MNANNIRGKPHLRAVKTATEIAQRERQEVQDANARHTELKREAARSVAATRVLKFTPVVASRILSTLH